MSGKLDVAEDHLNLQPGETKPLTVTLWIAKKSLVASVALEAEGLPPGVTAIAAMEKPIERPPLPNGGKLERYTRKAADCRRCC